MAYFAGLDVSVKETRVCIVDDAGKIVREARVASEPEALLHVLTLSRAEDARQINPDFVVYAKSYGIKGARVESTDGLVPALEAAFAARGVQLVAAPIDYSENLRVLVDELPANAAKNGEQS